MTLPQGAPRRTPGAPASGDHVAIDRRGRLIDRSTQGWVRATGTVVDLGAYPWLAGPTGGTSVVGDEWLSAEATRLGGVVSAGGGLIDDFDRLRGSGFDPARLASPIVEFYERTAEWRLEAWSQWSPPAWPFGWLLSSLFAERLQQLSLPLRPLDVARGIDSRVLTVTSPHDRSQLGAAWFRQLRSTGQTVYSGWYGITQLPATNRPSIRVMFPLPNGSIAVFLRPDVGDDGALVLTSPAGSFGDDGAYLIVAHLDGHSAWVRRVPLAERFVVWVDEEGTLRADHALNLRRVPVLRFHYRLDRRS
ncbi:MAG TPA: hypothetical protein VL337_15630 [Acidimicrobiales bacterium]|nr:hypothetical protein [Acidimicrobiales bacterium]